MRLAEQFVGGQVGGQVVYTFCHKHLDIIVNVSPPPRTRNPWPANGPTIDCVVKDLNFVWFGRYGLRY